MGEAADLMMDMYFDDSFYEDECDSLPDHAFGFWRCKDGKLVRISEMETSHIINLKNYLAKMDQELPKPIALELEFRKQEP